MTTTSWNNVADSRGSAGPVDGAPMLLMPPGWLIALSASDRLAQQLARADASVVGIVAPGGPLPPGASYRSHAARIGLRPLNDTEDIGASTPSSTAVLLRPGTRYEATPEAVLVHGGHLLLDRGAHVHDPWRVASPPREAEPAGRSPFPWRPVVVFLAGADVGPELTGWARRLVNELLDQDIESRLAVPAPGEGHHRTEPCLPSRGSIAALRPDVIVALDQFALHGAETWCPEQRSRTSIVYRADVAGPETVSWRIGQAEGRVRGRIGPDTDAAALAGLARRLCAGPHPAPPGGPLTGFHVPLSRLTARAQPRVVSIALLVGNGTSDVRGRADGFRRSAESGRVAVEVWSLRKGVPRAARTADVVMLMGVGPENSQVQGLVAARHAAQLVTVMDVGADGLRDAPASTPRRLTEATVDLVRSTGHATTAARSVRRLLDDLGIRALLLPSLDPLSPDDAAWPFGSTSGEEAVVGWHLGGCTEPALPEGIIASVSFLLARRPALRVEVVGGPVPMPLAGHLRITRVPLQPGRVPPVADWVAQLWTPPTWEVEVTGDIKPLIDAGLQGVPTVVPSELVDALDLGPGMVAASIATGSHDGADSLITALSPLLDDAARRDRLGRALSDRMAVSFGPGAAASVVNRFVGWALHGGRRS